MIINLKNLELYKYAIIYKIELEKQTKRRMADLGIIKGTKIKPVLKSPVNGIRAYEIRDILIAIRDEDANKIEVLFLSFGIF